MKHELFFVVRVCLSDLLLVKLLHLISCDLWVKQVAFFAFVKQNSLVWHLLFLVRSISFALYLRGVQYLQCASGRVPVWPFQVKIHDNQVICLLSTALS